jgi:DNA adenine methylase
MHRDAQVIKAERLSPLVKWAGGKEQELREILPMIPPFRSYYESFVGGGAVFFSIHAGAKFINDKSYELMQLYLMVAEHNPAFFQALDLLLYDWQRVSTLVDAHAADLLRMYEASSLGGGGAPGMLAEEIAGFVLRHAGEFHAMFAGYAGQSRETFIGEITRNLVNKTSRMKLLEARRGKLPESDVVANIESALKSAFYARLRHLYNNIGDYGIQPGAAAAIFYLVRENAYASMFRYNSRGEFNVPYGGISYSRKDLGRKIDSLRSPAVRDHLANTVMESMDFEAFLQRYPPGADDFIFLDPPYDSEFSTYAHNPFDSGDQARLAQYLLTRCEAKFLLVIKNTPAIARLYSGQGLNVRAFAKKYAVSFKARNNRQAEHLLISNYEQPSFLLAQGDR